MSRFNLSFHGEIMPGRDPEKVRQAFAELFDIRDDCRLEELFSGEPSVLRHDLDRQHAADYFRKLKKVGVRAELVEVRKPRAGAAVHRVREAREQQRRDRQARRLRRARLQRQRAAAAAELRAAEEAQHTRAARLLSAPDRWVRKTLRRDHLPQEGEPHHTALAPNGYAIRPFRNSADIRERAARARVTARKALLLSVLGLVALVTGLALKLFLFPAPAPVQLQDMAGDSRSRLLLTAGDQLLMHDRAGVGAERLTAAQLGLQRLVPPLLFDGESLLLRGVRLAESEDATASEDVHLQACDLSELSCRQLGPPLANEGYMGLAVHRRSGSVYLADPGASALLKLSPEGDILAWNSIAMPAHPVIRLREGLLYMNSASGPAISVFRPENDALGEQLDEILLMPPAAVEAGFTRVGDFLWSADTWWVSLHHPERRESGLYRFDSNWNFLGALPLPTGVVVDELLSWNGKTLVRDDASPVLQRFSGDGRLEAPLRSDLLTAWFEQQQADTERRDFLWHLFFALALAGTIGSAVVSHLQHWRHLVYRNCESRGAVPVDSRTEEVEWISREAGRDKQLRRLALGLGTATFGGLLAMVAAGAPASLVAALLLLVSGPAGAIYILSRSACGHVGVLDKQILLVDHTDLYHLGAGPRVQHHNRFIMVDDVVVYLGGPLLPGFDQAELKARVVPLARNGIRVDRATVAVRLLENRHPLAIAGVLMAVTTTMACLTLLL